MEQSEVTNRIGFPSPRTRGAKLQHIRVVRVVRVVRVFRVLCPPLARTHKTLNTRTHAISRWERSLFLPLSTTLGKRKQSLHKVIKNCDELEMKHRNFPKQSGEFNTFLLNREQINGIFLYHKGKDSPQNKLKQSKTREESHTRYDTKAKKVARKLTNSIETLYGHYRKCMRVRLDHCYVAHHPLRILILSNARRRRNTVLSHAIVRTPIPNRLMTFLTLYGNNMRLGYWLIFQITLLI